MPLPAIFPHAARSRRGCFWIHSTTQSTHEPYHRSYYPAMRILVVEDNDLVADAITMGLGAAGFAVDRTATAQAAATALATEHFDLALVDVGLPGMDGLTLVRQIRAGGATLPVMILTARDTLAVKVEALDMGADDFMMKPFEQAELVARCRALIRRANLHV